MASKLSHVCYVYPVVGLALRTEPPVHLFAKHFLGPVNGLQAGYAVFRPPAHIVDLAWPGVLQEEIEGPHQVPGVNVVSNLLPLVTINFEASVREGAKHEVGNPVLENGGSTPRAGYAAHSEGSRRQTVELSILLCVEVGGSFTHAEGRMHTLIYR